MAPQDALAVRVPNGERVFLHAAPPRTIFDGPLALPMRNLKRLERVRGPDMRRLTRYGLLAHNLGKGAVRVGLEVGAGIHRPRVAPDRTHRADRVMVSHFDGLTRLHWALKLQRHAMNGVGARKGGRFTAYRDAQIALAEESAGDLGAIFALHDRLRVLPPRMMRQMTRLGRLAPTGVAAEAAIARQFPDVSVDLSIDAFDADLQARAGPCQSQAA